MVSCRSQTGNHRRNTKRTTQNSINYNTGMVARERFELSSKAPEASMLNRYTTGLHYSNLTLKLHCNNFNVTPQK